ncbi:DUF7694 domain-containing protein [Rhizobium sp. PAMB 3182]
MRALSLLNKYRDVAGERQIWGFNGGDDCGAFLIPSPVDKAPMRVIASTDPHWEHVSVSRKNRCPNWPEMSFIKETFFRDSEACMQLHPPRADYINHHPYCLHIWRPLTAQIPLPETWRVGPRVGQTMEDVAADARAAREAQS